MWVVVAEPFGGDMEIETARLEGEVPVDEVHDMDSRRWEGVFNGFGNFENFLFFIEYFQW